MSNQLTADELIALIQRVFSLKETDRQLAIIVDMPDNVVPDTPQWKARREMAASWAALLSPRASELGLDRVSLILYNNPHANNADLPGSGHLHQDGPLPATAEGLSKISVPFEDIFRKYQVLIAPTQFSATAPLKMAAKEYGFRAATMPGFTQEMIPALRLDYGIIGNRVNQLKDLLDQSETCDIQFDVKGTQYNLLLDLRHRSGHASGGVFPEPNVAGNLPSGESYIVPYEGEIAGDPSKTNGKIPVQFGEDIVVYDIKENKAISILSDNPTSKIEAQKLIDEPPYGNLAELGLGVLGDFGLNPTGEILLDEKLGLHIAFGRSEHFGGQVGPGDFSAPDKVVHIDRVYIPAIQPDITINKAILTLKDGKTTKLMENNTYSIDFDN